MSVAIGEIFKSIHLGNEFNASQFAVAMVNHTAIHHEAELLDDECPETDYGNNTVVEQDGEFEWSTSKQGWILSSFFYGYVLTQVTTEQLTHESQFHETQRSNFNVKKANCH